jgi:hypothetical protein
MKSESQPSAGPASIELRALVVQSADGRRHGAFSGGFDRTFLGREIWRGPIERLGEVPKQAPGTLWMVFPIAESLTDAEVARLVDALRAHAVPGLSLYERSIPAKAFAKLEALPDLRILDLRRTALGDAELERMTGMPSLEHLFLWSRTKKLTHVGLRSLAKFERLRRLELTEAKITDDVLRALDLPALETLALVGASPPPKAGLARLVELTRLRELSLAGMRLADRHVGFLSELPRLVALDLSASGETRVSAKGLAVLKALPDLERITLSPQTVTDSVIAALDDAKLRFVKLTVEADPDASLSDVGLHRLAEHRTLEHVELDCGPPVTLAGVRRLGSLPDLRFLGLHGAMMTDAVLDAFRGHAKLETFAFERSSITQEAVRRVLGGAPSLTMLELRATSP